MSFGGGPHQPWQIVDENTIVAGAHPQLWVFVFDRERRTARLVGTAGPGHVDVALTRS